MKKLLVVTCASLVSASVMAAGYGVAGCGLGSVVLGDKPGPMQVLASTTNGTSGSQTFGITSGTSNCGSGLIAANVYVEANKVALANDIARGQGETLVGLAQVYGVKNISAMSVTLQKEYKTIFATNESEAIAKNIQATLHASNLL